MRLLIFCTRAELVDLAKEFVVPMKAIGGIVLSINRVGFGGIARIDAALDAFAKTEHGVLLLESQYVQLGFRVSSDTHILFSRDFPKGPIRTQAAGRNMRMG